jgi:hypothetical protein
MIVQAIAIGLLCYRSQRGSIRATFYTIFLPSLINIAFSSAMLNVIGFGIIHIVWSIVLTGAYGGFILTTFFFSKLSASIVRMESSDNQKNKTEGLNIIRDELNRVLRIFLQTYLALAAWSSPILS